MEIFNIKAIELEEWQKQYLEMNREGTIEKWKEFCTTFRDKYSLSDKHALGLLRDFMTVTQVKEEIDKLDFKELIKYKSRG